MPKIPLGPTKITKIILNLQNNFETSKITKITLKPSKDMDVVYMNELLEKRISHGNDYFGKDEKLKKLKVFFFEKNLRTK
jgi:hypothetical protein